MYSNRFIACVLVNGCPQRELANGIVPITFGDTYSLRFRNKHNRRSVVKFTIDGENVSGGGYIIGANSSIDIHRHFDKDARFKFVSLDSGEAVDAGKNGPNNDGTKGVIEAKFYMEKECKPVEHWWPNTPYPAPPIIVPPIPYPQWTTFTSTVAPWTTYSGDTRSACNSGTFSSPPAGIPSTVNFTSSFSYDVTPQSFSYNDSTAQPPQSTLQEGCTVEGGASGQYFSPVHMIMEDVYVLVKLVLKGDSQTCSGEYCTSCGTKQHKRSDRYCSSCGTKF